ncbi:MAG: glycoside hydrolase family 88 protein [Chitinophagaceae bacterium]
MRTTLCLIIIIAIAEIFLSCRVNKMNQSITTSGLYSDKAVTQVMEKVYDWQLANPVTINEKNSNDWARGAFYSGVMRAYKATKNEKYLNGAMKWSDAIGWQRANRLRHADDHTRGQTFLEIYAITKDPKMISGIRGTFDTLIAEPKPGREDWWWCDALFMAPPVLARLGEATGDARYFNYLNVMWWDATDFLFDKEENLYYRDKNFFDRRTANGKKVFWSRGNGWVMGGLVQVLEHLPKSNVHYNRYLELYKQMATKIASVQQPDGLWRASLLDPLEVPFKETSGSGFFTFAIAWGINNGHLDRNKFLPVVRQAWQGLVNSVEPGGKLGWVQQIGDRPNNVSADDNQEYGSGALLMAGTEMLKLND